MSALAIGGVGFLALCALILLQVPIGFAMLGVGLVGYALQAGWSPALTLLASETSGLLASVDLATVPLFLLMGTFASAAGFSRDIYRAAAAWFEGRGFKLHYDPGMEDIYFLIGRGQALGLRIEVLGQDLPNDPRVASGWHPMRWRDEHPLGIEGLQSIGISTPSLDAAREVFAGKLDWPEIGTRDLPGEAATCAAFNMGDTVIEAMCPTDPDSELARHVREVKGICGITFKVRSAEAAAAYLKSRGFDLVGDVATRFAIRPDQAFERLIWFTQNDVPGYPPLGSRLREPALFAAGG